MLGKLYIVATPIGNLNDITIRALETLKQVDFVLCEDTRISKRLLENYQLLTSTISYHQHSDNKKVKDIEGLLNEGKDLALITDAGTPGISDPGNRLIESLTINIKDLEIIPIPGPSAIITLLSISGFPTDKFVFLGFPPNKNKRKKYFEELNEIKYTVVLYESSHRIKKTLKDILDICGDRKVVVGRELTKKFETIYRGKVSEVLKKVKDKGEFVIVISNH